MGVTGSAGGGFWYVKPKWKSKALEKIIIPCLDSDRSGFSSWNIVDSNSVPNLKKIVLVKPVSLSERLVVDIYCTEVYAGGRTHAANVSFMYNFLDSQNDGFFWIDDLDAGSKIEMLPPTNPTREGYTFAGWYKESGCISAWDFSVDVTLDSENTKLYAKWEEK